MAADTKPVPKDIADLQASIARLVSVGESTTKTLDTFMAEQTKSNARLTEAVSASRGATGRTWGIIGGVVVASFAAMYGFVSLGTSNQIAPLVVSVGYLSNSVGGLQTQVALLGSKNVEVSTQVNCLEIVREYENSVQEMLRALEAEGALKIPSGQTMPLLTYHPFCQPAH